jgi:hypothetical protein
MQRFLNNISIFLLLAFSSSVVAQNIFDPDGYYFPEKDVVIDGYQIELFMLSSVSLYDPKDPSVDHDHPKKIPPTAFLHLIRTTDEEILQFRFSKAIIKQSGVTLNSVKTPIGEIRIKGIFLDKRGNFGNLEDVTPNKKPVFEGVISIVRNGKLIYEKSHRFTYWEGD